MKTISWRHAFSLRNAIFSRNAISGASGTIISLLGGTLLGLFSGSLVFDTLSGHQFANANPFHVFLAALPALVAFIAGSAVWGIWMGRIAQVSNRKTDRKRMALAGALGFAPITLSLVLLLQILEPIAVQILGAQFPLHRLFTFFFVPTAFLISGTSAWAIGKGLQSAPLARKLFLHVGLAAALAFLATNLLMETLGWQVGAPGADKRFTMLTVLFTSNFVAAVVGGAVMGMLLAPQNSADRVQLEFAAL